MTHGYTKDKDALVKRLHRIEGQVRGIERMVDDDRYCIDILTQIAAVNTALESARAQDPRRARPPLRRRRAHVRRRSRRGNEDRGAARGRPALRKSPLNLMSQHLRT